MYINVNFESIEEVKEFVKAFGNVGCNCVDQATKAKAKKETKPVEETKEEVKEVGETKEEVEETKEEVEETKEEVEETKEEVKTVTKEELTNAFKTKMKAGKSTELKAILSNYGAGKISEVNEEDREKVLKEVEAL